MLYRGLFPLNVLPAIRVHFWHIQLRHTACQGKCPKMESCFEAVSSGVSRAHVIDGRKPHALLVEVFTDSGTGTMITKDLE